MKLIFIRHGDAGAYTHPDHERNLSDTGITQASQTANWLNAYFKDSAKTNTKPDLFIVSPYNRARQTCDIVRQNFVDVPLEIYEHITPNDNADNAIKGLDTIIEKHSIETAQNQNPNLDCVVIVCHMNIVANMVAILTGDRAEGFSLAEARVLETEVFAPNLANEIARFVPKV